MVSVQQLGALVDVRALFDGQRSRLVGFLSGLDDSQWKRPTACDGWTVADLAAHLVGGLLGRIGGLQGRARPITLGSGESLEGGIDRLNAEWVLGSRLLSPDVIVQLFETFGPLHDDLWKRRSLDAPSLGVSWAGIDPAPTWLDAGRELTEVWVHDRQLREAVGDEASSGPGLDVILDVFARGMPYTLDRFAPDHEGASFVLAVNRPHISWHLMRREDGRWYLESDRIDRGATTTVSVEGEQLWRRWTRQPTGQGSLRSASGWPLGVVARHVAIIHSDP